MKKLMIIIAAMVLGTGAVAGAETGAVAYAGNPGFGQRRYTVTGLVEYSYNKAWGHHANFDVQ